MIRDVAALVAAFESPKPMTIGLEEEVMLLDPETLGLAERAPELLSRLGGDARFKLEMPASQLEIVTRPHADVPAAIEDLAGARAALVEAAGDLVRPAAAGAHPFSAAEGRLNDASRYEVTAREYGSIARLQLVCALQVHVAVGGAERSLFVYNALREHLPALAALGANAPFYAGRDTGLASVRPKVCELLPRQGVPPALAGWDDYAEQLRWGATVGSVPEGSWWWELRPHPRYGTLEVRVPDAQTTLADAMALAGVCHALIAWLAERHDAGEAMTRVPTWRIEENRWSACRYGVEGPHADLRTGKTTTTRAHLDRLLEEIGPAAERVGATSALVRARRLMERGGWTRQREIAARDGLPALAGSLADAFGDPL